MATEKIKKTDNMGREILLANSNCECGNCLCSEEEDK
jgi:hypothetical protein